MAVGTNGYVAAVWMASHDSTWATWSTGFIGYRFSTDSGSTWTPVQAIPVPLGEPYAADPTVAVDAANNFYVSFESIAVVTQVSQATEAHIWVAEAPSGTTTFGAPTEVTDPAESTAGDAGTPLYWYDKPWIAVTKNQEIVVTYSRKQAPNCPWDGPWEACATNIVVSRSTDAKTWTRVVLTSNTPTSGPDGGLPDGVNLAFPCVSASTDRLWVVYNQFDPGAAHLGVMLQYSDDDGATWSTSTVIAPATDTNISYDDPSCAGDDNDVWVENGIQTSGEPPEGFSASIEVAHSTNGGQTFGAPVNTLDTSASALAWHATLVRDRRHPQRAPDGRGRCRGA